ncbi:hypothetical protein HY501_01330 [Candidatus Woesearchaeota archaeon]|nr:hypothetical protein [Candidatus Woesearchaeota archaeon]
MKKKSLIIPSVVAAVLLPFIYFLFFNGNGSVFAHEHSDEGIHWHFNLTIIIDGRKVVIPAGIGITVGKIKDTELSGMQMSPLHTHDSSGRVHLESIKPRKFTLNDFFSIWEQQFDSSCILDKCIGAGDLRMFVNGKENKGFEDYALRDLDEIVIMYESKPGMVENE